MKLAGFWIGLGLLALALTLGFSLGRQPVAIATAVAPPQLVRARLMGQPVSVLYVTRSEDTVLVRCYPGQTPSLSVRPMGGQSGVQEGVLNCR